MKKISLILAGILFSCSLQAVNDESNIGNGVESDQIQMRKRSNGVIKKSIERTEEATLITEYDPQGNIIKIIENYSPYSPTIEFTFKDGKIDSIKSSGDYVSDTRVNKQDNTAYYSDAACDIKIKFNELGYKEETYECQDGGWENFYEYNKDGLLVKVVCTSSNVWEPKPTKTTTTYTYDVMSQDWTKRTGKDNKGNKTVTTRTVEYW
ncbi:MAG: hypothetical protein UH543_01350 [Bacteroidales bacterium]|nr:hypothetical protein [Bacteroidales bacterium]